MSVRVEVSPAMLAWAQERSRSDEVGLIRRFPRLDGWRSGRTSPTLKQLEIFARATHTPIGYFFLARPPEEQVPIPDYRTMGDSGVQRPSADLLDTIFACQQRQEWYRGHARVNGEGPVGFVGGLSPRDPVEVAATAMREVLGFEEQDRGSSFSEALRRLAEAAEGVGALVMISGVVGSNTHRVLDPAEFRGFALADNYAPLVFVNGADTKAAQIFTLAHELAHLWLGESALSDADIGAQPGADVEQWCNAVAAEFLVPGSALLRALDPTTALTGQLVDLARRFKVSTLVVVRRLHDAGRLSWADYRTMYDAELRQIRKVLDERRTNSGGDFYNTQPVRVSKRFARALVASTLEGNTLYTEAFSMLGLRKMATFTELAERLGVA
jgi:Zn-dependent peptidase ImmA (M78 family)/transcriptional regulator with XRE-family HTH domain